MKPFSRLSCKILLSWRLGENRLVAPDAAVPDCPEFHGLATQDRCRQVGPRTAVALYCLHERDGPRRRGGCRHVSSSLGHSPGASSGASDGTAQMMPLPLLPARNS